MTDGITSHNSASGVHDDDDAGIADGPTVVDERTLRILRAAIGLAEDGGFQAVRLRDVAQVSGVALGTVYKRFRSKEDLLIGVISHELAAVRERLTLEVTGDDRLARLIAIFALLTDFLCDRPNFGRAVIRSAAAGEQAMAERLVRFHGALAEVVVAALLTGEARPPTPAEILVVSVLQRVWFSLLVGWASGIQDRAAILDELTSAAALMIHGVDRVPEGAISPPAGRGGRSR
ncbi:MAG: TetR/AcrR family transcriptional regulator [Nannocystaceae bacterium]